MIDLYGDPAAIWRTWADTVTTAEIDSGHHMAEEVPEELATAIASFLLAGGSVIAPQKPL